jgi:preprotein translocase subunit SecE
VSISRQFESEDDDSQLLADDELDRVAVGAGDDDDAAIGAGNGGGRSRVPPRRGGGGGGGGDGFSSGAGGSARSGASASSNPLVRSRQFLHEVNVEMRKVAWPTRETTINYSIVVLVTLAILMAVIFGLDLAFSKLALFLFK